MMIIDWEVPYFGNDPGIFILGILCAIILLMIILSGVDHYLKGDILNNII